MAKINDKARKIVRSRKGSLDGSMIERAIMGIILIVVLFNLYATLVPTAQTAGDTLNASGVPLGSIFASDGAIFYIVMVGLLIAVIGFVKLKTKGRR